MKKSFASGFSLPELMITLALAAVVMSIAVPSMREFQLNNRLSGASNDLLRSLQLARNEAIKRQVGGVQSVVVCSSTDPNAATPACAHSAADFQGWIVFVDTDGDVQYDAGEELVEQHGKLDSVYVRSDNDNVVRYVLTGFTVPAAGLGLTETVVICDSRGVQAVGTTDSTARAVLVDRTGRSRVIRDKTRIDDAVTADATLACP